MAVVKGMMKIVLYDSRKESATFGEINEIFAGIHNPVLVHIPHLFITVLNVFPKKKQ